MPSYCQTGIKPFVKLFQVYPNCPNCQAYLTKIWLVWFSQQSSDLKGERSSMSPHALVTLLGPHLPTHQSYSGSPFLAAPRAAPPACCLPLPDLSSHHGRHW